MTYAQALALLRRVATNPLGEPILMHEVAQAQAVVTLALVDAKDSDA